MITSALKYVSIYWFVTQFAQIIYKPQFLSHRQQANKRLRRPTR